MTWLGKIFASIFDGFKKVFSNANHVFLDAAVSITQAVKDALNSKATGWLTALIPGHLDDDIVALLKAKIPILLADELLLQNATIPTTLDDVEVLEIKLIDSFGGLTDIKKEKFFTSIAAETYIFLQAHKNGEKVTFGQGAQLAEAAYQSWLQSQQNT